MIKKILSYLGAILLGGIIAAILLSTCNKPKTQIAELPKIDKRKEDSLISVVTVTKAMEEKAGREKESVQIELSKERINRRIAEMKLNASLAALNGSKSALDSNGPTLSESNGMTLTEMAVKEDAKDYEDKVNATDSLWNQAISYCEEQNKVKAITIGALDSNLAFKNKFIYDLQYHSEGITAYALKLEKRNLKLKRAGRITNLGLAIIAGFFAIKTIK
jgi:hypothetical protein